MKIPESLGFRWDWTLQQDVCPPLLGGATILPKVPCLRFPIFFRFFVILPLFLLVACTEEQILYTSPSPTAIPPVPEEPIDPATQAVEVAAASLADIKPLPVFFDARPAAEPVALAVITGVVVEIPRRYQKSAGSSAFRAAEFVVPNSNDPEQNGELIAFHFGVGQGGSVEDNLTRWAGQFRPGAQGAQPLLRYEQGEVGGFRVTRMTLVGTFAPGSMMPGAGPPPAQENWAMDAVIIEGPPEGTLFLRLTGPRDLVMRESSAIEYMASRLRLGDESESTVMDAPEELPLPATGAVDPSKMALVEAAAVRFLVPEEWEAVAPTSSMRALELRIPAVSGNRPSELVVFAFPGGDGGSAEENIRRWISQVAQPDGSDSTERALVRAATVNGLTVTRLDVEGSYAGTAMNPMAPAPEPQADTRLVGIVIEGAPRGSVFVRITGPARDVRLLDPEINTMIQSLEVAP